MIEQRCRRLEFHNASVSHDRDPIADLGGHAEIVGDENHRQVHPLADFVQQLQDLRLNGHIQGRHRLIRHQNFGFEREGTGNADALALTAGELVWETVIGSRIQAHGLKELTRPVLGLIGAHAHQDRTLGDDLPDPRTRVERRERILKDHLDL